MSATEEIPTTTESTETIVEERENDFYQILGKSPMITDTVCLFVSFDNSCCNAE